ncbi:hypothetical protein GDO86_018561 [Hymenochirus boettgeri]|uniref:CARD domain-containing protein n=1 Tax=Hymenochirus boettgeri TaxID=247094 RepID=A0A8T2IH27_9PIPI|nr:hypothetical protein GDO86_018561 [Hymenochirus boettgeri]
MLGGMEKHHKNALMKLRIHLLQEMVIEELVEHLVSSEVLTPAMHDDIMTRRTALTKNVTLLNLLPRRGPRAYEEFCKALCATGQRHLAQELEKKVKHQGNSITHQAYTMFSRPRGVALLMSNIRFDTPDLDYRSGGDVDSVLLQKLFSSLSFQVEVRSNLSAQVNVTG